MTTFSYKLSQNSSYVMAFLRERGLELSEEKTHITHIDDGFDFLGFNIQKYHGKLLIKPAKSGIKRFLGELRELIKTSNSHTTAQLIWQLFWFNKSRHLNEEK